VKVLALFANFKARREWLVKHLHRVILEFSKATIFRPCTITIFWKILKITAPYKTFYFTILRRCVEYLHTVRY
jgi:hypothetical protein